jgi:cation:H+ antiporter
VSFLSFASYPLWLNGVVFMLGSVSIWFAGVRLERNADAISERTGLGKAFTGMLLLAAATSLPEVATTITAVALLNNPTLAVYNLVGGVALQTGIIAVADWAKGRPGALTYFNPRFVLLIEGVGLLVLLQLTIAGLTTHGLPSVASISAWSALILLAYIYVMYLTYRHQGHPRWTPSKTDDSPQEAAGSPAHGVTQDQQDRHSTNSVWLRFALFSLLVLGAGWIVAQSADVLADQTGLGDAFLGATLLALATSLPEVSTTTSAARNGRYSMAISNVFGSNAFDVSLLFLADLLYRGGTIMEHAGASAIFVAAIGAIMTTIYLWGMLERRDRAVFGVGRDSAAAVIVYLAGMTVLYFMGQGG